MTGLELVTARRIWFVPDLTVWGQPSLGEHDYLALENTNGTTSAYHGTVSLCRQDQQVRFDTLTDHRGNTLPASISAPRIIPRSRGIEPVFIVGRESTESFRIARESSDPAPVTVDLLIIELGD